MARFVGRTSELVRSVLVAIRRDHSGGLASSTRSRRSGSTNAPTLSAAPSSATRRQYTRRVARRGVEGGGNRPVFGFLDAERCGDLGPVARGNLDRNDDLTRFVVGKAKLAPDGVGPTEGSPPPPTVPT